MGRIAEIETTKGDSIIKKRLFLIDQQVFMNSLFK